MTRSSRRSAQGFTLIEIMVVVCIIGVLLAIAIPGWMRARAQANRRICQENLFQLDGAKEQWALEKKKGADDAPPVWSDLVGTDLYIRYRPRCPFDGLYTINTIGVWPTCTLTDLGHILPEPSN